jgi:hypothetical protein
LQGEARRILVGVSDYLGAQGSAALGIIHLIAVIVVEPCSPLKIYCDAQGRSSTGSFLLQYTREAALIPNKYIIYHCTGICYTKQQFIASLAEVP